LVFAVLGRGWWGGGGSHCDLIEAVRASQSNLVCGTQSERANPVLKNSRDRYCMFC